MKILKKKELAEEVIEAIEEIKESDKEHLLALYEELKTLNVRSISDLENLIARA